MKRTLAVLLTLALCIALLAGCGNTNTNTAPADNSANANSNQAAAPAPEQDEKEVTVIFGHPFANNGEGKVIVWNELADKLESASGGSMKMEIIYDGAICDDSTVLESIQNGTTQLGHGNPTYFTGLIPELSVVCVPGAFSGDPETHVANLKKFDEVMDKIFAKYGLKYLSGDYTGVSVFVGNGTPIAEPGLCSGKLIRTSGTDQANAVGTWGGASTVLGLSDLISALERKTVDSAFTGEALVNVMHLYEITDYVVYTKMYESPQFFFCSMDFWDSLSEKQQNALMSIFDDVYSRTIETDTHDEYIEVCRGVDGYEVVELSAEETDAFVDPLKSYFDKFKEGNSEEGIELMKLLYEIKGWDWE